MSQNRSRHSTGLAQRPNGLTGPCPWHCGRAPRSPRPGPTWWEPTLADASFGLHGGNQHVEGVAPGNRQRGPGTGKGLGAAKAATSRQTKDVRRGGGSRPRRVRRPYAMDPAE
jgi:hypothetical protein